VDPNIVYHITGAMRDLKCSFRWMHGPKTYVLVDHLGTSGAQEVTTAFTREPRIPRDVPPMHFMLPDGERAHFGAASLTQAALPGQATKIQLLG